MSPLINGLFLDFLARKTRFRGYHFFSRDVTRMWWPYGKGARLRDPALTGGIASCSWARHFPLTVPVFTQEYKWVPSNLLKGGGGGGGEGGGKPLMDWHLIQGE